MNRFKTIGVLGGMGPAASAHFYQLLLKYSQKIYGAVQDDEYPQIIINSLALTGSTEKGMEENELIVRQLSEGIKALEKSNSDFIVIPCNSVHNVINELRKKSDLPIISIIEKVSEAVIKSAVKKVLVLASETTDKYGLYDHLSENDIEILKPDKSLRKKVTKLILSAMGNKEVNLSKKAVINEINKLLTQGKIDSVILGCTELPLAISQKDTNATVFDSLEILAKAALECARND